MSSANEIHAAYETAVDRTGVRNLPTNGNHGGSHLECDPYAGVPPPDEPPPDDDAEPVTLTTWEPVDLGPYLRGEVQRPEPCIGVYRSDGVQFLYPGREHSILGGTEAGKTWVALMCVAAELLRGNTVAYVHFEESDPGSTIERLRLLNVPDAAMVDRLRFAAPAQRVKPGWLAPLLEVRPSLAVLDGINEAIVLHGQKVDLDGWSLFRQEVIVPFKAAGAAVLGCDHMPISNDENRRDAYGTGHKGNILDGSRLMLVNKEPFGRGMRGRSQMHVTKDRPGQLRIKGKPGRTPGVTFIGTLVVDDSQSTGPDFIASIYAPKDDETTPGSDPHAELAETVHGVLAALPDRQVASTRLLFAELRNAGHEYRDADVRDAVDDLIVTGRLTEVSGKRGAKGYQAVLTASQGSLDDSSDSEVTASRDRVLRHPPTGGGTQWDAVADATAADCSDAVGRSGTQSGEQDERESAGD